MKIKDRIRKAYNEGIKEYYSMLHAVFPADKYPNAFRYQSNGGPPGCAMAFSRALREMKGLRNRDSLGRDVIYLPPESRK